MPINIQNLLDGDSLSQIVDRINYNFDQIVLAGGGPQGPRGIQGLRGPAGPPGPSGEKGEDGTKGSIWFFGTGDPNSTNSSLIYPNGSIINETEFVHGDIFFDTITTKIYVNEHIPPSLPIWVQTGASFSTSYFELHSNETDYYLKQSSGNIIIGYESDNNISPNSGQYRLKIISTTPNHLELTYKDGDEFKSSTVGINKISATNYQTILDASGTSLLISAIGDSTIQSENLTLKTITESGLFSMAFRNITVNEATLTLKQFGQYSYPTLYLYASDDFNSTLNENNLIFKNLGATIKIGTSTSFTRNKLILGTTSPQVYGGIGSTAYSFGNDFFIDKTQIRINDGILFSKFNDATVANNFIGVRTRDTTSNATLTYSKLLASGAVELKSSTGTTISIKSPSKANLAFTQELIANNGIIPLWDTSLSLTSNFLCNKDGVRRWFFTDVESTVGLFAASAGSISGFTWNTLKDVYGADKYRFLITSASIMSVPTIQLNATTNSDKFTYIKQTTTGTAAEVAANIYIPRSTDNLIPVMVHGYTDLKSNFTTVAGYLPSYNNINGTFDFRLPFSLNITASSAVTVNSTSFIDVHSGTNATKHDTAGVTSNPVNTPLEFTTPYRGKFLINFSARVHTGHADNANCSFSIDVDGFIVAENVVTVNQLTAPYDNIYISFCGYFAQNKNIRIKTKYSNRTFEYYERTLSVIGI